MSLEISIVLFFFRFLISSYFSSVDLRVFSIVSGGFNLSSSGLFYAVFYSLYWCINAIFNAGNSSSFFSWYSLSMSSLGCKVLCIIIFLVLWSICFSSSLVHFMYGPEYLSRRTGPVFIGLLLLLLIYCLGL